MNKGLQRKIAFIVITLMVITIGWLTYSAISKNGKVPTEIVTVPEDAKVAINGKSVSRSTIYLRPGEYIIEVSKEGFNTESRQVKISNKDNQKILSLLTPKTQKAQAWARENDDKYFDFEGLAGDRAAANAEQNQNSIENVLPYQTHLYSIGTKSDPNGDEDDFIATVRAPEIYREAAIQQIKNLGYNPAEYNIEFIDYRSPFNDK